MDDQEMLERTQYLMDEIYPISQHPDIEVVPCCYNSEFDTLHLDIIPRSGPKWAETAYSFAKQPNMKYDRDSHIHGIDGQPRVSYSGLVWVRYVGPFIDGSKIGFHIWSDQHSHREAEEQLGRLYGLFRERDGLEPMEVFRKYLK